MSSLNRQMFYTSLRMVTLSYLVPLILGSRFFQSLSHLTSEVTKVCRAAAASVLQRASGEGLETFRQMMAMTNEEHRCEHAGACCHLRNVHFCLLTSVFSCDDEIRHSLTG